MLVRGVATAVHVVTSGTALGRSGRPVVQDGSAWLRRQRERTGTSGLRRVLGLLEVTAGGVGIIIGAGIYVLLGPATALAGGTVWISFLVAAGLCGLTGLGYAELSSMFPRAGAEYEYTRQVAPEPVAFVVGWTMIGGLVIASATIALGFARYLQAFVDLPVRVGAWGLLGVVALVSLAGIRRASWLVLALGAVQVGGLLFVIVIGFGHLGRADLLEGNGAGGVVGAAALVFFAFIGFDEVITLAEETRDPTRTVPRALLLALGLSAALYALVSIAAVSVLSPAELGTSTRPLADVMTHVLGGPAVQTMAAIAVLTTTNTTLLAVTAASRLTYGMADAGSLPPRFAAVNRRGAPWTAVLAVCAAAAAFVAIGDLTVVAGATDFAVYVVFLAVNAVVVILRIRRPDADRPFRIRGAIGRVPVVPVIATAATLMMIPQLDPDSLWLGLVLVGTGAAVMLLPRRAGPGPEPGRRVGRWLIQEAMCVSDMRHCQDDVSSS